MTKAAPSRSVFASGEVESDAILGSPSAPLQILRTEETIVPQFEPKAYGVVCLARHVAATRPELREASESPRL